MRILRTYIHSLATPEGPETCKITCFVVYFFFFLTLAQTFSLAFDPVVVSVIILATLLRLLRRNEFDVRRHFGFSERIEKCENDTRTIDCTRDLLSFYDDVTRGGSGAMILFQDGLINIVKGIELIITRLFDSTLYCYHTRVLRHLYADNIEVTSHFI